MNTIRLANTSDANAILDIYAPYILNTSLTFETEVPAIEAFSKRIHSYMENYPWLVCEIDGLIAGYAYATRHRERAAYQWCTESSVYIHDEFHQRGIGRALYSVLVDLLKQQGFRTVYAVINLPNAKSVAFHEKCGFSWFADYKNVGYKLGQWKTVGWWQLQLNDYSNNPAALIKFTDISPGTLQKIFHDNAKLIR